MDDCKNRQPIREGSSRFPTQRPNYPCAGTSGVCLGWSATRPAALPRRLPCGTAGQLLQVIEYQGHWVALLDWGLACWKLADREAHIGWTHQQHAQRLGLVVQNRRFLVLGQERMPNLASRALGLALKALPEHWQVRRDNRTYPASSLLVLIAMALFSGVEGLTSIQSYGNLLTSQPRGWLDFPVKKGTKVRKAPS